MFVQYTFSLVSDNDVNNLCAISGDIIDESTFMKVIKGLNETIGVVLEYLQDAKVSVLIL